jgi:hypothetical protein
MEVGRCPACAEPYSSRDLAGFGVLRPRREREGGPRLQYVCPRCGTSVLLVPHGEGRYAPEGEATPAPLAPEERRPPWLGGEPGRRSVAPDPPPRAPEVPPPPEPPASEDPGPDLIEALQILGVGPLATPEEIERAFKQRSLACHPDKVAHLDGDFQALAARKFRRLVAAYELLSS